MGAFLGIFSLFLSMLLLAELSVQKSIQVEEGSACRPSGNVGQDQYLIGYGSLISSSSKNRTYENTGENIPVLINGYARVWNCKGETVSASTTYLGTVQRRGGTFNGVVFKIPNSAALLAYDEREQFYCRQEVSRNEISRLVSSNRNDAQLPPGQFWIYVTKPQATSLPTQDYPIVQSYVDVFLSGCLEMEEAHQLKGYAEDCIRTTEGWDNPWINDRIFPRRPFVHQPEAGKIDKLIANSIPNQFRKIKLE